MESRSQGPGLTRILFRGDCHPRGIAPTALFPKSPNRQTLHINIIVNDAGKAPSAIMKNRIRCAAPTLNGNAAVPNSKWRTLRFE